MTYLLETIFQLHKKIKVDDLGNVYSVSEVLQNGISHIKVISYDQQGKKRWERLNENTELTHQKALDIHVKNNDWEVVFIAQCDGRQVHHLQAL